MAKKPQKSWAQHVVAWKESGLSKAEFCRQAGLAYRKFGCHCRRSEAPVPTENVFVPLAAIQLSNVLAGAGDGNDLGKSSGIRLCLGGVWVELECGFCSKTLSALLSLLDQRC